jgi:PPP family 3-phenylpropionic acid transporter
MVFLLSAGLIQASHAVLYGFGTIHWRQAGYADGVIGLFWAEGVVAEIILFALGAYLLRRFGAVRLILLGGICGTIRWGFTGITDDLVFIIILQGLHAFTFGATHLGAMHFISQTIEPRYSASAQSIYSAAVAGLAMGFAAFFSGMLYDLLGGRAYFAMSAVAAAGSLLAAVLILVDRNRNSNL